MVGESVDVTEDVLFEESKSVAKFVGFDVGEAVDVVDFKDVEVVVEVEVWEVAVDIFILYIVVKFRPSIFMCSQLFPNAKYLQMHS